MAMNIYAGIGSRDTPPDICASMTEIAKFLAARDWVLRSGRAPGADVAFEAGADRQRREIYLPWYGFNGCKGFDMGFCVPILTPQMLAIAEAYHPNWAACSSAARKLHVRNVCQILGLDCMTPAKMVICWTPGGKGSGGTGQAIRIAKGYNIPVFDIALEAQQDALCAFLDQREAA